MHIGKNKLHIEVIRSKESNLHSKELSDLVKTELKSHSDINVNYSIRQINSENLRSNVHTIQVCELERLTSVESQEDNESSVDKVTLSNVKLCIHVYRLYEGGCSADIADSDDDQASAVYWTLPTVEFNGLWDSLVFDSDIKEKLLRYAWTTVQYSMREVDTHIISCNRIIMLHGPPGTGKTSLCKAVCQKLSIRLSSHYRSTVLVEINAHSLFSKYFSESGKLVARMFSKLGELVSDSTTLVCVLMDEVESLTHSRAAVSTSSEPSDAIRVVNAVLTQLDKFKQYPNVLFFSTSNISGVVDSAFQDRADISFLVPQPSSFAVYTIYLSCIHELIRVGMLDGLPPPRVKNMAEFCSSSMEKNASFMALKRLSMLSEGLSGRTLRKIPMLAHSFHLTVNEIVSLDTFYKAMEKVIIDSTKKTNTLISY